MGTGLRAHRVIARAFRCVLVVGLMAVMVPVGVPAASAQTLTAETYWVDDNTGLNLPGRGSQAEPFATITYAASVSDSLDTIMVEPGTYNGAINEVFPIILNGQSLISTGGSAVTTIQGNGAQELLAFSGWDDGDSLEGFTIRDGGIPAIAAVEVQLTAATEALTAPTIADCTFTSNDGGTLGGALYVSVGTNADLKVVRNTFQNNSATAGGAMMASAWGNLTLGSNQFDTNVATRGAALNIYTGSGGYAVVEHNVMGLNTAGSGGAGGAIYWQSGTSTAQMLRGNTIYSNIAPVGGAMYLNSVTLDVEGNDCSGNAASGGGSTGFAYLEHSTVSAKSNYLVQNSASNGGAVWTVDPTSTLAEFNDTVAGNFGGQWATYADPAAVSLTIVNCIYSNGGPPGTVYEVANADNIRYSFSRDSLATLIGATHDNVVGAGMVYGTDPGFDGTLGPPALAETSPCLEAGDPSTYAVIDIYDTVRPQDGDDNGSALPDIGCYEKLDPTPPVALAPVYRFYNFTNNTHFFTPSLDEANSVIANYPKVFRYEGICYYTNPANNTQPLYRFYNRVSASHFYTASLDEANHILATWPHIFTLDGQTYAVNPGPVPNSMPVYRFFNLRNGSHFYTASAEEADMVIATWPTIYRFEGPAFWLGQ